MVAMLLATFFAGAALLALSVMVSSWLKFGFRFRELRQELGAVNAPLSIRYAWRDTARASAIVYNLDFKAKAESLPFHPQAKLPPVLLAAA